MTIKKDNIRKIVAAYLLFFGVITLFVGSSVLLDMFGIRKMEGNYIPFVVIANLGCAVLYVFAAVGIWKLKKWAAGLMILATIVLILTSVAIYFHIQNGGAYEQHMIKAMSFRTLMTAVIAILTVYLTKNQRPIKFSKSKKI